MIHGPVDLESVVGTRHEVSEFFGSETKLSEEHSTAVCSWLRLQGNFVLERDICYILVQFVMRPNPEDASTSSQDPLSKRASPEAGHGLDNLTAGPADAMELLAPNAYICPIKLEIMSDPVVLCATGITYDRDAIHLWLKKKRTCPKTNQIIPNQQVLHLHFLSVFPFKKEK